MLLEKLRRHAAAIAHDCCKYDGAIDVAASSPARSSRGGFENSHQRRRYGDLASCRQRPACAVIRVREIGDGFALQARRIDVAGRQHVRGIGIIAQGSQYMFERNFTRARGPCTFRRPGQCRCKSLRNRNMAQIGHGQIRHAPLPTAAAPALRIQNEDVPGRNPKPKLCPASRCPGWEKRAALAPLPF